MKTFKKLKLQNFLSFKEAELNLDNQNIVLIEGEHVSNKAFTSNGSGKSSLFEAFCWCNWDNTIRGYKGDKVVNRTVGKDCFVSNEFTDDDNVKWEIRRYRKHTQFSNRVILLREGVEWNSDVKVQDKIDSILGLDFKSFISSFVFYRADEKSFTGSSDAEQKKLLQKLYDLEKYNALNLLAKEKVSQHEVRKKELENKFQTIKISIDDIERNLETLSSRERDYEDNRAKKEVGTLRYIEELEKTTKSEDLADYNSELEKIDSQLKQLQIQQNSKTDINEFKTTSEFLNKEIQEKTVESSLLLKDVNSLLDKKVKFEKNLGLKCPVCEQDISSDYKNEHIKEVTSEYTLKKQQQVELSKILTDLQTNYSSLKNNILLIEKTDRVASDKQRELLGDKTRILDRVRQIEKEESEISAKIQAARKNIEDIKKEKNPYSELIASKHGEAITQYEALENLEKDLLSVEKILKHYQFFETAFSKSGIQSYLLDNILPVLNKHAKYYSSILAGGAFEIEFSNQTTLKSKEVREKFEVRVVNKEGADDYMGDSSGEKRRIDLAVLFSLQKTAIQRSKSRFNVLFLDEIFDTLDGAGLESVVTLLEQEAQTFPSIFVISHSSDLSSYFDSTITVQKKDGESILV